ncbi:hypothetical protein VTO42DRAFT_2451 [Malbranchea cinnamomea]
MCRVVYKYCCALLHARVVVDKSRREEKKNEESLTGGKRNEDEKGSTTTRGICRRALLAAGFPVFVGRRRKGRSASPSRNFCATDAFLSVIFPLSSLFFLAPQSDDPFSSSCTLFYDVTSLRPVLCL